MSGSTEATASGWRSPATPARTPTGVSAASTAKTDTNRRSVQFGGDAEGELVAQDRHAGVAERLGDEGEGQHGPVVEADAARREQRHDHRGAERRSTASARTKTQSRRVDGAAQVTRKAADEEAGRDEQRDERRRSEQQHRDEHELAGDRVAGADVELELRWVSA